MDKLQIVFPYYDNAQMLEKHIEVWKSWPRDLQRKVRVVIVDDGSEKQPALPVLQPHELPVELMLFRILINIRWNQNGARNLAMTHVDDGWVLSTDADHVIPESQLRALLSLSLDPKMYYRPGRRQFGHEKTVYKRHPNSYVLTKELYWRIGGYDEDFAGYYGSDCTFRNALKFFSKGKEIDPYLVVYNEKDIPDANTTEFDRKTGPYYAPNVPALALKRRSIYKPDNPIRFPWERQI
jgi:hypothetical protein